MRNRILVSVVTGAVLSTLAFVPAQGAELYAISGASHTPSILYELNPADGSVIQTIGNSGVTDPQHISSLACQPGTGQIYGYVNEYVEYNEGQLATIDVSNGLATVLASSSPNQVPDMTFTPDGDLYGWSETTDELASFDTGTGVSNTIGGSVATRRTGLASNSSGTIYMKAGPELYTVNPGDGVATFVVTLSVDLVNSLAFDENDELYSLNRADGTSYLMKIDIGTGNVTTVGDIGVPNMSAIEFKCDGAVQTLQQTWGEVKSLYR